MIKLWRKIRQSTPLGEPGCIPLYVGLPSALGSVDSDHIFPPFFVGGLITGEYDKYKRLNKPMALEMSFSLRTDPAGEHGGGLIYQGL